MLVQHIFLCLTIQVKHSILIKVISYAEATLYMVYSQQYGLYTDIFAVHLALPNVTNYTARH